MAQGKGTFRAAGCPGSPPVAGISPHKGTANLSSTPRSPAHETVVNKHLPKHTETRQQKRYECFMCNLTSVCVNNILCVNKRHVQ